MPYVCCISSENSAARRALDLFNLSALNSITLRVNAVNVLILMATTLQAIVHFL